MGELGNERQDQYTKNVKEDFPEQVGMINLDKFYSWLEEKGGEKLVSEVREAFESDPDMATTFVKMYSARYGHNPGDPAAAYREEGAEGPCVANMKLVQKGKGMGYINTADADLAIALTKSLYDVSDGKLVATIIKHEMPSGVALSQTISRGPDPFQTYEDAWGTDSLSNFGGVAVLSYGATPAIAERVARKNRNTEVLILPEEPTDEVMSILAKREGLRVGVIPNFSNPVVDSGVDYKRLTGALLMENRVPTKILTTGDFDCISEAKPMQDDLEAALLAWHATAFTRSNSVVIGTKNRIHGIGSGQRSRIDAANQAILLSQRGYGPEGTIMASDAYMPATDVVKLAAENGVRGIAYPLGSKMDDAVLEDANEHGLIMLVTRKPGDKSGGERRFVHR